EKICRISEKPPYSGMVNTGCYVLTPPLVAGVPHNKECTILSVIENALGRGEAIGAYTVMQDWIDVGRMPDLARALGTSTFEQVGDQTANQEPRRAAAH